MRLCCFVRFLCAKCKHNTALKHRRIQATIALVKRLEKFQKKRPLVSGRSFAILGIYNPFLGQVSSVFNLSLMACSIHCPFMLRGRD